MSNLTGQGLVDFCKSKLGTPYVYGAKLSYGIFTKGQLDGLAKSYPSMFTTSYYNKAKKFVGQVCTDCSGLPSEYLGKMLGSYQMYKAASVKTKVVDSNIPVGAVLWRPGHVGVYAGNNSLYEAKGINYGTVKSQLVPSKWDYFLLFKGVEYSKAVNKTERLNPYRKPIKLVVDNGKGSLGKDAVKWIQFELREAGFKINIDGFFGPITIKCVKDFQRSCKIQVDGKVGPDTVRCLIAD